ncbi:hypothetical protein [Cetobacterium sp.]|uniref:hypothetical protein n=1 Tax=Cetobacterium sp. TaxID=2071632 RepID=UPI003F34D446
MKKSLMLVMCLFSITVFGNIPDRVYNNIEREATDQDNRSLYIRTQERAYGRILSLGKKEGLSFDRIESEVLRLEKRYGTDYETIYKNFYYNVKELAKKQKNLDRNIELNKVKKKEYEKIIGETKIPLKVSSYIQKEAEKKYPENYSERVKYIEELIKFYNYLNK